MGSILISIGLVLRLFQIFGAFFGLAAASGSVLTAVTLCFLAGGLAVLAYEHRGKTTVLAVISAVAVLMGSALQSVVVLSVILYFLLFAAYGLMLLTMEHIPQRIAGGIVLVLGVCLALQTAGLFAISAPLLLCLLAAVYLVMGVGLYL